MFYTNCAVRLCFTMENRNGFGEKGCKEKCDRRVSYHGDGIHECRFTYSSPSAYDISDQKRVAPARRYDKEAPDETQTQMMGATGRHVPHVKEDKY